MKVDFDIYTRGEARYKKVKYYYFDYQTRLEKVGKFLRRDDGNMSLDQWGSHERNLAFIADMDAKFLFVPKTWIRQILLTKLSAATTDLIFKVNSKRMGNHLNAEQFNLSQRFLQQLNGLNILRAQSFLKQALVLQNEVPSEFWKKLHFIQKINYTSKRALSHLSVESLIKRLKQAQRYEQGVYEIIEPMQLTQGPYPKDGFKSIKPLNNQYNANMESGQEIFNRVCENKEHTKNPY